MVSHEQDKGDYQHFVRHLQRHYPKQKQHSLTRAQLTELEPELGRSFNQGLYLPQEGQIGNRRLLVALRKQLEQDGVHWLSDTLVTQITSTSSKSAITYQTQNGQSHKQNFDLIIDCRGTGATRKLAANNCAPLSDLRSVRGELFQLFAPEVHLSRPIRLMHPRYQLYIAPKEKGFYVVGATEIESDDTANMTVRSAMELLSAAYSVHPGFAEANIRQHISQNRPAFNNNQPQIRVQDSLIQINGLFRHGFLISPVVLQQVLALVNNKVTGKTQALPYDNLLAVQTITTRIVSQPHNIEKANA
jgi:glycine oxidase